MENKSFGKFKYNCLSLFSSIEQVFHSIEKLCTLVKKLKVAMSDKCKVTLNFEKLKLSFL